MQFNSILTMSCCVSILNKIAISEPKQNFLVYDY